MRSTSGQAVSPDGKALVAETDDRKLKFWDPATGKELREVPSPEEYLSGIAFTSDGKALAVAGKDVHLLDPITGKRLRTLEWNGSHLTFSPDGKWLAAAGSGATLQVWNLVTAKPVVRRTGHAKAVLRLVFSRDGKYLVSAGYDKVVRVWDVQTGETVRTMRGQISARPKVFWYNISLYNSRII